MKAGEHATMASTRSATPAPKTPSSAARVRSIATTRSRGTEAASMAVACPLPWDFIRVEARRRLDLRAAGGGGTRVWSASAARGDGRLDARGRRLEHELA